MTTSTRTAYLRTLPVPTLQKFARDRLRAAMLGRVPVYARQLAEDLSVICDRLEWIAAAILAAGMDPANVTYGGLLSTRPASSRSESRSAP